MLALSQASREEELERACTPGSPSRRMTTSSLRLWEPATSPALASIASFPSPLRRRRRRAGYCPVAPLTLAADFHPSDSPPALRRAAPMKKRRRGSRNACQRRQRRWGWEWEGEGISERGVLKRNSGRRRGVSVGTAKREREKKKGEGRPRKGPRQLLVLNRWKVILG
jgi:hypothetical protein